MGTVDEVRSAGSRSGRKLTITGKGFDTTGKVKEPQQRHFDEMTIEDMLAQAGQSAGVGRVLVDPDLASIMRTYEHMDDESFAAFGQRIAEEVGGTFKLRNGSAVLAKRNSQRNPGGLPLPSVIARWGDNLHSWDVVPFVGRHRFQQVRVRYYERDQAKHDEVVVSTNLFGTEATAVGRYEAPDRETAQQKADSLAAESERQSGVGSLTIEGNVGAQPEATCVIAGTRPGVDGAYLIDGVDHTYTRGAGFTTKLTLANRI
jgi:phage protein D